MATQEKLLKSLDILKSFSIPNQTFDPSKKKDKIQHCHVVTEAISNTTIKIAPYFQTYLSITIEVLLQLCDDQESDVRMTAGDCLNRIIRAMNDGNIGKVQIELHKGIKQNGSARSLRAALKRFAQLAHLIRPHKGKPYVVNLFPTLIKVSERSEEQIHETLAASISSIMQVLGCFSTEMEIKGLLKGFLKNVSHQSAAIRRSAATCVLQVCLNCKKPLVFMAYVVNYLLDLLIPLNENQSSHSILGVMTCLKNILPHLNEKRNESNITDISFVSVDKYLQIYELCLHYFSQKDHNVINASLETLNTLLQNCGIDLKQALIHENGIDKSRVSFPSSYSSLALRSPSQLSVATTTNDDLFVESELTDTLRSDIEKWIDQSKLSVIDTGAKITDLEKSVSIESKSSIDVSLTQTDSFDYKVSEYVSNNKTLSINDNIERLTISDDSSEKSFSYIEEEKNENFQNIMVGCFLEPGASLVYCARLITKLFLLSGQPGIYLSDKTVRVSVKSLALSCLASIVKIYPQALLKFLDKTCTKALPNNVSHQPIADVLCYEAHADPQLRGVVRTLLANFIFSVLKTAPTNYNSWIRENNCDDNFNRFRLDNLVKIIIKGLEDESSSCARQTILSLGFCLEQMAESSQCLAILPLLKVLPYLGRNPYWLVKVALCELVSSLPYITIHNINSNVFQDEILDVLFQLLRNEDSRVRNGAANAIVTLIPNLYYEHFEIKESTVTTRAKFYKDLYLANLRENVDDLNLQRKNLIDNMPFPFSCIEQKVCDKVEFSLSIVVSKLYSFILTATSSHFIYGCIETLSLLSTKYPTTTYCKAWNCCQIHSETSNISLDLLTMCVYFLNHSIITYDLTCHLHILNLSSNLYAGYALHLLKPTNEAELSNKSWNLFDCPKFSNLSESYLSHMVKLLNIVHYVLDEVNPSQLQSKPVLNLSTASPIKRRKSDLDKKILSPNKTPEKEDKDKKDSKNSISAFVHLPHYIKIYEVHRQAYTNYKVSLESEVSEKFSTMLKQILHSFSVLMEIGTLAEFQGIAEEILGYFRLTFLLEASSTVECVQQLLKCLFGSNLTANISEIRSECKKPEKVFGFYNNMYQEPYSDVSSCFNSFQNIHKVDDDSTVMGYLHRRDSKPVIPRGSDKILANYIRIFEPMVIKSLKHYTISSDVKFQCKVLQLLNQLIQLRVNYCLLDSEQIFIGFVLKQFDYIEKGQIPFANELITRIFQFLVQLSHSKQHSKSIITVPKIINLCDGLMASEQSPVTHCIPALQPIVENIFLTRNKSNSVDAKELETTRDVVLSMLLRLYEHHEVINLICLILDDSKYCNNSEKWLRWSSQVMDVILSMLRQNKIRLDSLEAVKALRKLIFVVEPSVLNVDTCILLLFQEPLIYENWQFNFTRRLAKVLTVLLILSSLKEESLILKVNDLKANFAPGSVFDNCVPTTDPLNVLNSVDIFQNVPAEMIIVRFLFKVLTISSRHCTSVDDLFLVEEISTLLMYLVHIFSGSHCKIAVYAISNISAFCLGEINDNFLLLAEKYPILMILWSYVLTLLNFNDREFWNKAGSSEPVSLNQKVISAGNVISFCDFMNQDVFKIEQLSWFLEKNISQVINLCHEEPVAEFVSSVHRNSETCEIFLSNLRKRKLFCDSIYVSKLLKCVENTHPSRTGHLLKLLLPELLTLNELSISRSVANLASRKIELLLTMPTEVHEQLLKEDLLEMINKMTQLNLIKKHEALASLLNKLCTQSYDISILEFDQCRNINPQQIKNLQIDKNWFLAQIKEKCDKQTAELLIHLNYDELHSLFETGNFKLLIKECIRLGLNEPESPLIKATSEYLFCEVGKVCEASQAGDKIFGDSLFLRQLYDLTPAIIFFLDSLPVLSLNLTEVQSGALVKFAVISLRSINYLISVKKIHINYISLAVSCSEKILKGVHHALTSKSYISELCSIVNNLYRFVEFFSEKTLPDLPKFVPLEDDAHFCHQLYILVTWLYKLNSNISESLLSKIKSMIISLSRLSVVNSYVLIPAQVWKSGWSPELGGPYKTQVPPLPIEFLQEVDILEEFIFRITLLGWTSRQQFEETWMCFLSVLCNNFEEKDALVLQEMVHASSLAVKAITTLLVQTLYFPQPGCTNVSELMQVTRDLTPAHCSNIGMEKLRKIHNSIEAKYLELSYLPKISNVFKKPNLEKRFMHYSYGQVSVRYLLVATKTVAENDNHTFKLWQEKENLLEKSGLDINSCLQFLLDYYTQLLKNQASTPLRFLHEIVRSTVIISDLFTDKSQFSWMLEIFLELSKVHTVEDELLHQYLIVGLSKAVAVLTPDLETYEAVKKLLVQYLKSSFLPSRMACLYGLLYILEGCKLSNISIGNISDEMQIILPCAVEYVQCNINTNNEILKRSQEHTVLVWTLAFFLVENVDENHVESSFITNTLQTAFSVLLQQKPSNSLQAVLMKALERLVIFKKDIAQNIGKQIMSLALEKIKNENPYTSILGIQLLLTYMYTDCADQLETTAPQTNPDHLVQIIEKISAIFEHVKKGYVFEVEILCAVLPHILNDFFSPADILTKVIGEFLSPQQPHPKLLSGVVFKIFERAIEEQQLPLLQDWVVFSLSNITQFLSIGMATWCLTCFFISASSNKWLRLFFPYVQTRVGRYEYADRKMFCIAGLDFYKNLTNGKQKETFVENFNKIKDQPDTLFTDLLSSL